MLRIILIGLFFINPHSLYCIKNDEVAIKERGWLVFRENVGVLFAQDSIPCVVSSDAFFNKVMYAKGVDVSYYDSIYSFEKNAENYRVVFLENTENIRIIPVEASIRSRKSALGVEPNAWIFKRVKDSVVIQFNSPDTLFVSDISPYKKKTRDCYKIQTCSK